MTHPPLPSSSGNRRRYLALVVSSGAAMLADFALAYALGTVHALERQLARGGHHGV